MAEGTPGYACQHRLAMMSTKSSDFEKNVGVPWRLGVKDEIIDNGGGHLSGGARDLILGESLKFFFGILKNFL